MSKMFSRSPKIVRVGAATIEFAFVFPILILFLMGIVELGRGVMVQHTLEEAARAGCRVAVSENGSKADVLSIVDSVMDAGRITDYSVEISPDPPTSLGAFQPVTVRVTLPYKSVTWVSPSYLTGDSQLSGACVMPAEGDGATDPLSEDPPTAKKNKKNLPPPPPPANKKNKKDKKTKKNKTKKSGNKSKKSGNKSKKNKK